MKTATILIMVSALALVSAATAVAKDKGAKGSKGASAPGSQRAHPGSSKKETGVKGAPSKGPSVKVHVSIGSDEQKLIQGYVEGFKKPGRSVNGLPPGLARNVARGGELPPGWQKKCVQGAIMPVEIFKLCHPLPRELVVKLPAPPPGTILVAIDGSVVRLHKETHEIHAVFDVRL